MAERKKLGQILVEMRVVSEEQVHKALLHARQKQIRVGEALVELGFSDEENVTKALCRQFGLQFVNLEKRDLPPGVADMLPAEVVVTHRIIPVKKPSPTAVIVALDDPERVFILDDLRFQTGVDLRPVLSTPSGIRRALETHWQVVETSKPAGEDVIAAAAGGTDDDAPVIRLVDQIIMDAVRSRASDIHVEPLADRVRVRYRIDGVCQEMPTVPKTLQGPVLSRLKILANMDMAEKRRPQDGRIAMKVDNRDIDFRVSALPAYHGESLVMRILDKQRGLVSLEQLGFHPSDNARFDRLIKRPNGIFLVTGPTGSGKTTTLYAALQALNRPDVKIITAENPVEYNLSGINQCGVNRTIGLTFARILRSMLRQAPDIILVGEIRDLETAEIAIQAALTGHLVFSTLHTNDAPSAITRLVDMGVKRFLVSTAVMAVMAQRLVRVICPECREPYSPEPTELRLAGVTLQQLEGRTVYRAKGCPACRNTGYKGRIGIFELFEMDTTLRELVFKGGSNTQVREQARISGGLVSLLEDGVRKVLEGSTTFEEVLAATVSGEQLMTA
ncbi:MAG: Flp pilus assembly complex ATPase component TadA [Planctomycetes bacterium]|jgi:type IV pilus assembly protein PilB|nr:Flp pilus assembly complex ATPase component TadA [Planctomycetota bacterium]